MPQRRGRRSREDQLEQAILLFRQELIILEDDESFGDCRGVQAMIQHLARETLKRGTALDLLIQGAVTDVTSESLMPPKRLRRSALRSPSPLVP